MLMYGFFTIGLLIGFLGFLLFGKENGLSLLPSLFLALLGSITTGLVIMAFDIGAEPLFAAIGSVCFLFIGNVFRPKEDTVLH